MAFTVADAELSASKLLKRVAVSRPTLYRLLHTLQESGFIVAVGEPQRFRLGPSVAHLSHVWSASFQLADIAEPVLRHLRNTTGETAAVFVRQGAYRTCIAEVTSSKPLNFRRGLGCREAIVRGASGRAILAFERLEPSELEQLLAGTAVERTKLEKELKSVRERGYAVSRNELEPGAIAVAAPFFDGRGHIAGSLAVFGPGVRLGETEIARCAQLLVQEAQALSQALGARRAT